MKNIRKVIVLGGGPDQVTLIQKLKSKFPGVFIYLVDYSENPVAKPLVDEHICVSTLDTDAVADFAERYQVDMVIVTSNDPAIQVMADVSERLGLPCYLTYQQTLWLTDKMRMKDIMVDNDIPTAKYKVIHSLDKVDIAGLSFPLMVKPADGCYGSKGVCKVNNGEELMFHLKNALEYSRTPSAIVEEFKTGTEISIDAYVSAGKVKVLMVSQLNKFSVDGITSTIYQSIIPAPLSDFMYRKISDIADKICRAFKLENSPLLVQAIVQNGEISIIELTARIGGGAKYITIPEVTGFDILNANIDSMLNIRPSIVTVENKHFYSRCQLYTYSGIFNRIEGVEELIKEGKIKSVTCNGKSKGDQLNPAKGNTNRFASVFIKADSYDALQVRVKEVISRIKIIDTLEKDILNRSMYE